jgi:alkylhydroperoxidase family enzyme
VRPQFMAHELAALQRATHHTVLDGPGEADLSIRRQVALGQAPPELAALVQKIRDHAYRVTDADVEALRARYSEDQLFELIVAAALGAAEHRLQRALAVLEDGCD